MEFLVGAFIGWNCPYLVLGIILGCVIFGGSGKGNGIQWNPRRFYDHPNPHGAWRQHLFERKPR